MTTIDATEQKQTEDVWVAQAKKQMEVPGTMSRLIKAIHDDAGKATSPPRIL